jgi:hypothetical protein
MSKRIYLDETRYTTVDEIDYEYLETYTWRYHSGYVEKSNYKITKLFTKTLMHRMIMENVLDRKLNRYEFVDHINHDTLDNRRENLRIANIKTNGQNRLIGYNNTSGYKGVHFVKRLNKWQSRIQVNNRRIHLGYFETPEMAAKAYDKAAIEHHGEFANLNFPIS